LHETLHEMPRAAMDGVAQGAGAPADGLGHIRGEPLTDCGGIDGLGPQSQDRWRVAPRRRQRRGRFLRPRREQGQCPPPRNACQNSWGAQLRSGTLRMTNMQCATDTHYATDWQVSLRHPGLRLWRRPLPMPRQGRGRPPSPAMPPDVPRHPPWAKGRAPLRVTEQSTSKRLRATTTPHVIS
jgi:hypothetical protein